MVPTGKRMTRTQKARRMLQLEQRAEALYKEARRLGEELAAGQEVGATVALGGGQELVLVDPFVGTAGQPKLAWKQVAFARFAWETRAVMPAEADPDW